MQKEATTSSVARRSRAISFITKRSRGLERTPEKLKRLNNHSLHYTIVDLIPITVIEVVHSKCI